MHFPPHPCPKYPPQQLDRVVNTCRIEDRRLREGEASRQPPALFCFASSSRPAKWRSSVIAPSSTFPAFSCAHPRLAGLVTSRVTTERLVHALAQLAGKTARPRGPPFRDSMGGFR
ncbi:hypothetical protein K523DRAFT_165458 [Schizophyllum commune Tattone D]|nr:hypothetical protein K523DRAFT_165458 [Schizophyllum commune Tattone D]